MYAPTYGFGQGGAAHNAQPQPGFNQNALSPAQPSLFFQGQQQQQQQQQMMYNPQQYGGGSQQNPYAGMSVNPAMMQGSGGMAHMSVNNGVVQGYQTPYTSSPYNTGTPSAAGVLPILQQYMAPTSNNTQFGINTASMTPQQQQRMHPPSTSTPNPSSQRISPYSGAPHNTPPQTQTQSQYMTPQNTASNQPQQVQSPLQTRDGSSSQQQQQQSQNTPQTPNFPPNSAGVTGLNNSLPIPLSPVSEAREKERVSLLLDINRELLIEVMRLQAMQAEAKRESSSNNSTAIESGDSKPSEKPSPAVTGKEFVECMRRLQANLAYLAAIADRSHKPSSQIPSHPAIISPPPLSPLPKPQTKQSPKASLNQNANTKTESSETANGAINGSVNAADRVGSEETEDRLTMFKALYARLQALFPGVDPRKEPPFQAISKNAQQKGQMQRQNPNPSHNQMLGQGQGTVVAMGGRQ